MTQHYDGAIITVRSDSITALVASLQCDESFCQRGSRLSSIVYRNFRKTNCAFVGADHPESLILKEFDLYKVHLKFQS